MIYGTDMAGFATGFVHRRIIGGVRGFITGGPAGAIAGALAPRSTPPRTATARPTARSEAEKEAGRQIKLSGPTSVTRSLGGCGFGFVRDAMGRCVRRGAGPFDPLGIFGGPAPGMPPTPTMPTVAQPVGEAVMGRYGAALVPGSMVIDRAICLRGMQLGNDGLCYNKGQISNKQRMWPRGRKPLLTGGEMRAITIAASAGRRVERTTQRLQDIGFIKKPIVRRKTKKKTGH